MCWVTRGNFDQLPAWEAALAELSFTLRVSASSCADNPMVATLGMIPTSTVSPCSERRPEPSPRPEARSVQGSQPAEVLRRSSRTLALRLRTPAKPFLRDEFIDLTRAYSDLPRGPLVHGRAWPVALPPFSHVRKKLLAVLSHQPHQRRIARVFMRGRPQHHLRQHRR